MPDWNHLVREHLAALPAKNSDAHSRMQLDQIRFGVFQARRGLVEARSVITTWPWAKFSLWLSCCLD